MVLLKVRKIQFLFIDTGLLVEPGCNSRLLVTWFRYIVANIDLHQQGFIF